MEVRRIVVLEHGELAVGIIQGTAVLETKRIPGGVADRFAWDLANPGGSSEPPSCGTLKS